MSLQGWASQAEAARDVSLKGACSTFYHPKMSLKTFVSTLNLKGQKLQQIQNDMVSQEEEEQRRVKPISAFNTRTFYGSNIQVVLFQEHGKGRPK